MPNADYVFLLFLKRAESALHRIKTDIYRNKDTTARGTVMSLHMEMEGIRESC